MKYNDARLEFLDNLFTALENNKVPWRKGWDQKIVKPINGVSNKPYRGINQLNLWMTTLKSNFEDPRWYTFKQANELGYRIAKGSVGINVYHYSLKDQRTNTYISYEEYKALNDEERANIKLLAKVYKVFNGSQVTGLEPLPKNKREVEFSNSLAANFTSTLEKNLGIEIQDHENSAFYRPGTDEVFIPYKTQFNSEQDYYGTVLHEFAHATGHPKRLNRKLASRKNITEYAKEELRAEIASAFLCMETGFSMGNEHELNHHAYIQSWSEIIKNNPNEIFNAINDATNINNYLVKEGELSKLIEEEKKLKLGSAEPVDEDEIEKQVLKGTIENDNQIQETGPSKSPHRIFVDMDGVLARFNNQIESMEVLYEKGYYESLEPLENVVSTINQLIDDKNADVYILSAVLDSEFASDEKRRWLAKYLPEMDDAHIIFSAYGQPKTDFIAGGVLPGDILLDDYTKNLEEWKQAGGVGIKLVNDINDSNKSWKGHRVDYKDPQLTKSLVAAILEQITFASENESIANEAPNDKMINLTKLNYNTSLDHFLTATEAFVYLKLGVPIGHLADIKENGDVVERWQYKTLTDEEKSKANSVYLPVNSIDELTEIEARYEKVDFNAYFMMHPNLMTEKEAARFYTVFNALTDRRDRVFSLEQIEEHEQKLLDSTPMNYQKMMKLRDQYLTDDVIKKYVERSPVTLKEYREALGIDERTTQNKSVQVQQTTNTQPFEISLETMKDSVSIAEYARDVLGMGVIKESRGLFRLDEHDSCKIYPNNTFYRFSQNVGGSIVDFIKHFEEVDIKEAIARLKQYYIENTPELRFNSSVKSENRSVIQSFDKDLELPEKAMSNKQIIAYLTRKRGITESVVNDYIKKGLLYEDIEKNCVFVGRYNKTIHYAAIRGTKKSFKGDVYGGVKEVGVYVGNGSDTLVLNEAVIDQMSYQSLVDDPKAYDYLSCNGVGNAVNALRFHMVKRKEASNLKKIIIGLDNDSKGLENAEKVVDMLKEEYPNLEVCIHLPENGVDFNEQLQHELGELKSLAMENQEIGKGLEIA